jgi:hypothetical protein
MAINPEDNTIKNEPVAYAPREQIVVPESAPFDDPAQEFLSEPDAASEYEKERIYAASDDALLQMFMASDKKAEDVEAPKRKTEEESTLDWIQNYASSITPSWVEDVGEVAEDVAADIGKGVVMEGGHAIARGVTSGFSELIKSVNDLGWWLEENIPLGTFDTGDFALSEGDKNVFDTLSNLIKESGENLTIDPTTVTGEVIQGVSQFLASAGVAGKVTKALGVAPGVYKRTIDAIAGAAAGFDPYEERLSNVIQDASPNVITDFLQADEEDPAVLARLKSGLENGGLGLAAEGVVGALRVLRAWRKGAVGERAEPSIEVPQMRPEEQPVIRATNDNSEFAEQASKFLSGEIDESPIKVNVSRFEGPEDIQQQIANISRLLPEEDAIPQKVTMQQADALGIQPQELIKGMQGQIFDRRQIAASWMMFRSAMDELIPLANKARASGSPEDVARFNAAFQTTYAILRTTKKQSSEIARALEIHKRLRQPDKDMAKALQKIIDESGGTNAAMDLAEKVSTLKDPKSLAKFAEDVAEADGADKILFAYSNILMSNPATQVVNILDTASSTLWRVPSVYTASKFGDDVMEGEARQLLFGQIMGIRNGLRYAARTLKTGQEQFLPSNPMEIPGKQGVIANDLGAVNSNQRVADYLKMMYPTNMSRAGDQLLKVINYQGTINQLAYRHVMSDLDLAGDEARDALTKMIADPPKWLKDKASAQAIESTFNEKLQGEVAPALAKLVNGMRVGPVPMGRIMFATFVRTPINLFRWTAHNTPAAFMSPKIRAEIAAGGAQRDMALARVAAGTAFMGSMAAYVAEGKISGAGPKDYKLRQQMKDATGWQPYSVQYAPGKWISYNRFATVGGLIGIAADSVELMSGIYTKQSDTVDLDGVPIEESVATSVVVPFANAVLSKVYMQQLTAFMDALSDPNRYGESYFNRLASSFVPAVVGAVERTVDPEIRRARDWMDSVAQKIPGLSESVSIRLDAFGREQKDTNGVYNIFLPARLSEARGTPIDRELGRMQETIGMPKPVLSFTRKGIRVAHDLREYPPEVYDRYIKLSGGADPENAIRAKMPGVSKKVSFFEYLNDVVSGNAGAVSKQYDAAGDEGKMIIIRTITGKYRKAARQQLLSEYPEIASTIEDAMIDKMKDAAGGKRQADAPRLPTKSELSEDANQPMRVFGIE